MNTQINPLELLPTGLATNITLCGGEESQWVAEINAMSLDNKSEIRVRLTFGGAAQIRMGNYEDREVSSNYLLTKVKSSIWVDQELDCYVKKFGTNLLPVVKNLEHYVLRGHDLSIGFLARKVECSIIKI